TGVAAGTGLTGGGTSGNVSLALDTSYTDGRYARLTLGPQDGETGREVKSAGLYTYNVYIGNINKAPNTDYGSVLTWGRGNKGAGQLSVGWTSSDQNSLYFRSLRDVSDNWWSWKEIWHSGNDGSGSGLDADTLDGQHASAFASSSSLGNYVLKSGDSMTGALTISTSLDNAGDTTPGGGVWSFQTTAGNASIGFGQNNGGASIQAFGIGTSYNLHLNPVAGQVYIRGNQAWHSGNDGAGSGLDADTVDGYAPVNRAGDTITGNHIHNSNSNTDHFYFTRSGSMSNEYLKIGTDDSRTYFERKNDETSAEIRFNLIATDTEFGGGASANSGYIGFRTDTSGRKILVDGNEVWHSGNDGSGSGLDADTLDGQHASDFASSSSLGNYVLKSGDTMTGELTISKNNAAISNAAYSDGNIELRTTDGSFPRIGFHRSGYDAIALYYAGGVGSTAKLRMKSSNGDDSLIWHSLNDGSGSGLDADLLDGIDNSRFVVQRSDISASTSWDAQTVPGMYGVASSSGFTGTGAPPSGIYGYGVLVVEERDGQGIVQTYFPHQGSGSSYVVRRTGWNNGAWTSWAKVWQSNNDGSGSGLDADLVDGINSASFLRSDVADSFTGPLTTSADSHITFGPNSGWNSYLRIGGNGRTVPDEDNYASIVTTNGNLHLDAGTSKAIYLNYYEGNLGVMFGNGGSATVAVMGPDGDLWKGSSDNSGSKYWHSGNDGSGSGLDADLVDGYNVAEASTASTIALRNSAGDINARLFRSEYDATNSNIGYIMTQIDTATNNYIRPSTPAQLVTGLGLESGGSRDIWVEKTGDTMSGQLNIITSSTKGISSEVTATSGTTSGVYGSSASTSGMGVSGYAAASSGTTYGVRGFSSSTSGRGVYGVAGSTSGINYGVFGSSSSSSGRGVHGVTISTSGTNYGVYGASNSASGFGLYTPNRVGASQYCDENGANCHDASTGWQSNSGKVVGGGQHKYYHSGFSWVYRECTSWDQAYCSSNQLNCPSGSTRRQVITFSDYYGYICVSN
ncbi:MAG: hypothetical protein ACOCXG_00765, partial [Nanoarchaeota archaeon]